MLVQEWEVETMVWSRSMLPAAAPNAKVRKAST